MFSRAVNLILNSYSEEFCLTFLWSKFRFDFFFQLLKALAHKKRRQVPLLKALVYHLTRKKDMEDIKLVSDALFAVGSLNMKDPELLETACINGAKAFEDIKASDPVNAVVRSILSSLGHLSIFHENILDSITNWYTSRLEQGLELDNRDLLAYLMTTAHLNHQPINSEPIYKVSMKSDYLLQYIY
jgi:hypothetical protein